jgi:hypothetical protein
VVRGEAGASDHAPTWVQLGEANAPKAALRARKKSSS